MIFFWLQEFLRHLWTLGEYNCTTMLHLISVWAERDFQLTTYYRGIDGGQWQRRGRLYFRSKFKCTSCVWWKKRAAWVSMAKIDSIAANVIVFCYSSHWRRGFNLSKWLSAHRRFNEFHLRPFAATAERLIARINNIFVRSSLIIHHFLLHFTRSYLVVFNFKRSSSANEQNVCFRCCGDFSRHKIQYFKIKINSLLA